jgi:hypothetical protein
LSVLSFPGGALSADVIMVVMIMKGVMMNPMTMTTMKNITMIGMMRIDRNYISLKFDSNSIKTYIKKRKYSE